MKLADTVKRRRVKIACLQETNWKGDKVKELTDGYELYYTRKNSARNGVGIVVFNDLKEKYVRVKRVGVIRLKAIKLV